MTKGKKFSLISLHPFYHRWEIRTLFSLCKAPDCGTTIGSIETQLSKPSLNAQVHDRMHTSPIECAHDVDQGQQSYVCNIKLFDLRTVCPVCEDLVVACCIIGLDDVDSTACTQAAT